MNHVVICRHCHYYVNMLNVSCVLMDHMVFCIQNKPFPFKFELVNKITISYLSVQQSNYHPLGAVGDPINCCPRPSASGNSSSGHPQHLGGDSFDCCTERYEIVVYCISNTVIFKNLHLLLSIYPSLLSRSFSDHHLGITVLLYQVDNPILYTVVE